MTSFQTTIHGLSPFISFPLLIMYYYELSDILFFIKCLQFPDPSFPILNYVSFSSHSTRSGSCTKLAQQLHTKTQSQHFFFKRIVLFWNTLPTIDLSLSFPTIKRRLYSFFHSHFLANFDPNIPCSYHIVCPCYNCSKLPVKTNYQPLVH